MRARLRLPALFIAFVVVCTASLAKPPTVAASTHVIQNAWDLYFEPTDGDGTRVTSAKFNGVLVFASSALVYIFVNYASGTCCTDNLGNSVRKTGPTKSNVTNGFSISATYCFGTCKPWDATDSFGYKYVETYTFLSSGEWKANLNVYGPGLQPSSTYEIFWRVDYDISTGSSNSFQRFNSGGWQNQTTEHEYYDDYANASGGYEWRQNGGGRSYSVDPLSATIEYGDLAVLFHAGELGGSGSKQYPGALYDNNESIGSADIVEWYHGFRTYSRPSGCTSGGAGCTTAFPVYFRAVPSAY